MAEATLGTKTVKDLDGFTFTVPHYQRGYRWSKKNVQDLLDDIYSFSVHGADGREQRYCLQPVVVRQTGEKTYAVIDGQQRLTTLLLILKYAAQQVNAPLDYEYRVEYETRPRTKEFLDALPAEVDGLSADAVPDFFYMREAWDSIGEWARAKNLGRVEFLTSVASKAQKDVMLIWYEVPPEADEAQLFRRLNLGRIPLTNAELIKALLLTRASREDRTRIAYEWDQIEHALQNDDFWYFLTSGDDGDIGNSTRIDLLFDTWVRHMDDYQPNDALDPFSSFRRADLRLTAANLTQSKEQTSKAIWEEVKDIFSHFMHWYTDFVLYHRLGYLLAVSTDASEMFSTLVNRDKSDVLSEVEKRIRSSIRRRNSQPLTETGIDELEVADDRELIARLHLLFNIETILAEGEKGVRFSFRHYKQQQWDVEHIHAVSERMPQPRDVSGENLAEERKFYMQALYAEISSVLGDERPYVQAREILDQGLKDRAFESDEKASALIDHPSIQTALEELSTRGDYIGNTVLLDSATNRSYGNEGFGRKRREIIKQSRGVRFIPPVTRNVFLGYYRDSEARLDRWTEDDQKRYVHEQHGIVNTLQRYLAEEEQ